MNTNGLDAPTFGKRASGVLFFLTFLTLLTACGGGGGGGGGSTSISPPPPPPPPPGRSPQSAFFIAEDPTLMQRHLFSASDEGGALTQLTPAFGNPDGNVVQFALSPDKQTVAYVADGDTDGIADVYVVPAAGGTSVRASSGFPANTGASRLIWSPDSSKIAYIANPLGRAPRGFSIDEVFVADRDGSNNRKVNGSVGSPPSVGLPDAKWSPDSRYLAQSVYILDPFYTLVGINIYDTQDTAPNSTRITPALDFLNGERMETDYAWSQDSSRVAFRSSHDGAGITQLYTVFPDGSSLTRINPNLVADGDVGPFGFSPDGSTLIYVAQQLSTEFDLFASDISGAGNRRLNTGGSFSTFRLNVQWSPDGSQIAYSLAQDTPNVTESYVTNVDGSGTIKLHPDLVDGQFANGVRWSPDGTQLAFVAELDTTDLWYTYVVNADGSDLTNISMAVLPNDRTLLPVVWSLDSRNVAYFSQTGATNQLELYVSTADGTAGNRINADLGDDEGVRSDVRWSEDSTRLVYYVRFDDFFLVSDNRDIWAGTPDGNAPIMLNGTNDFVGPPIAY
ncbi:MAG: hypothetical protein AAGE85_00655 [Pseudomonadota bacterium]